MEIKFGLEDGWVEIFYKEINKTSMKRTNFELFVKAYKSRDVIVSLWRNNNLIGFGSMLTDWSMNSVIYEVVVVEEFRGNGHGKQIMSELMSQAPDSRFYLTSTFGHEDFYKKLGFKKHKTAFALYKSDSPYLE